MDEVTRTRNEYEAARAAWQAAEAQMQANTRVRGDHRHNRAERQTVDALHKALHKASQAYYKARFDAGLIQA